MKTSLQKAVIKFIFLILLLMIVSFGYAQTTISYTSSGTFIPPAGVTSIQVNAFGAGGGGGHGGSGGSKYGGGGGGGGGFSQNLSITVTAGTSYPITIGTAGTAGTASSGGTGGTTTATFGGTTITANGGGGGGGGTGSAGGSAGTGGTGIGGSTNKTGGAGKAGSTTGSGGGGGGAAFAGNGGAAGTIPAAGASGGTNAGAGGTGSTSSNTNGTIGNNYGGGGGGGTGSASGAAGGGGYMTITYTCPTYSLTSSASATGTLCSSSSSVVTLRSTSLTTGTYTVTYNLSGSTTATGSTATMSFNSGSPGTGIFNTSTLNVGTTTITITNLSSGTCNSTISLNNTASTTVIAAPTAVAGANINTCSTTGAVNITSGATATNYTSILWTSSGTGTFANSNSLTSCTYLPSAADIALGNVTLTLTANGNSPCTTATSTKTLTISPATTAVAGTAISFCSIYVSTNVCAGATATNQTSAVWTSSGSGTFTNANSLTACTYTPSSADIIAGSVILTLTATNAGCSATSTKTLTITSPASANAGTVINLCNASGTVNITAGASATNYSSITWTSSGTGTFTNPNSLTTCTYTPSAADNLDGGVTLTLTAIGLSPCFNDVSTKALNILAPTATAGDAISTCSTSSSVNITSGATATNYTTVTWTSNGTGTFTNANSLTTCTYTPSVADITAGSVILTLTASSVGCSDDISTKVLTIYSTPTITTTVPATRTGTGTTNIGATPSAGTPYWYANLTGGTSIGFGSSFTTPSISATTTYYVEAVNGTCSSSPRTAVVATVNYSSINVTGNAIAITNGSITASTSNWTDFGATNSTRTFTINNTGVGILNIGAITFSGANASDFSVTTLPSNSVGTSSSTTFIVTFNPSAAGIRTATISIINNDSSNNPYTFALQGTGVVQGISIQGNATTITNGSSTTTTTNWTDFSNATNTRTFTIINSGNVILNIGTINFTGANASDFSIQTAPSATIAAYGSTTFTVLFTPSATGTRNATISIINNDSTKNPFTFAISGSGATQLISIKGNATAIINGASTASTTNWTDFSTVTVTRTYTIYNTGTLPLTIGAITFTGTNPSDFSIQTPPSSSIPALGSTTFTVLFTPGAAGTRSATINIVNNDSTKNPFTYKVQGTGVVQGITIQGNATSITNGSTTPSTSNWTDFSTVASTRTFTIINGGNFPLTIGAISFSGTNAADFSIQTAPSSTIATFGSSTFTVLFTPSGTGTRTATISIVNNDSTKNPFTYKIQGTGGTLAMTVTNTNAIAISNGDTTPTPTKLTDFGNVSIDSGSVIVTYTITNSGTGTLFIGAASFTGLNASDFSMTLTPSSSIAPGGTSTFEIAFNPTIKGTKTATFSLVTNATGMNPFTFAITGLGVQTYLDTDGDGVTDNKDLDDDNDGIPDIKEQSDALNYPTNNLVQYVFLNETFGAGKTKGQININIPGATTTSCYEDNITTNANNCASNSSGVLDDGEYCVNYIITNTNGISSDPENLHHDLAWTDQRDHTGDLYGRMAIFNADFSAGSYFYQAVINGVLPNTPTTFSFWVMNMMRQGNLSGTILPNITIEFRDVTGATLISSYNTGDIGRCSASNPADNTCGPSLSNWLNYTTTVNLGNVTDFIIKIKNNAAGGGGNDFAMDDITISQLYVDSDGDGIPNIFDLDDENDGIPDIEEAGYKAYSNGSSKMDPSLWVDANHNGLHDAIDAQIAAGTYSIPDTDGDGVPNYLDLDSDNDSLFDVDEAGMLNGDGDINDDGKGDLLDSDKDGILDLYDNYVGFGTISRASAQDTDGDGIPDYLDLDSNNDGIYDIQTGLYGSLDANNDGIIDGSVDIDKDGILDTFDTNPNVIGSPRDLNRKLELDFDGRNDYAENAAILGGLANASLMAWIDLNSAFSTDGVIVGQDKFQIRVTSAKNLEVAVNSTTLTYSTVTLNTKQWYNVAAVYGGGLVKLYLNGVLVASQTATGNIAADATKLTLGKNPAANTKYFKGKIDEIRVFNTALTDDQVEKMVYQEIQNTSSQVRGAIIPKKIPALPFANLLRYYRMDTYKDDIVDDLTTATIDKGTGMKLYNFKNIYVQQAPMPFVTQRTGSFATAIDDPTNDIRGLDAMDQDWSIIQVNHNITEVSNNIDLGMFVNPSATITMNNDTKIQNDWYLKLDGTLLLSGKSQLVQTTNSDLDVTSAGNVHRDQQGQSNLYNYNYWSSPVGPINTSSNNNSFTVDGVMKDGTTGTPQNITWTTGLNGSPTSPITLSSYWIFKYQNLSNAYANWASVGQTGALLPAQGYTLKGSGATTATQNYTFVGKPNNGTITTSIAAGNLNLSGNPYPSAIDSNAFIVNNSDAITGTIYFWQHASSNNTHTVANYQGGYSALNLTGGTGPVAPVTISGVGTSSKIPNRYIPVGQGFFIVGSTIGGTVTFDNSIRGFVKEDDAINSNTLFKQTIVSTVVGNNAEDFVPTDTFKRVRLGLNSTDNYHRQILLGFMENHATDGIDVGYDAINIDNQLNDMYFMNSGTRLNIQGVGYFDVNKTYPLGIKTNVAGPVDIMVDKTEHLNASQKIYILDNTTGIYHDITSQKYTVQVPAGLTETRFSLTFKNNSALATNTFDLENGIDIAYYSSSNILSIKNNVIDTTVEKVSLFNMLGQLVNEFDVKDQNQQNIQVFIRDLSTGTYIVKVKTDKGDTSKKIIFN